MIARFAWRALRARYRDNKTELDTLARHIKPGDIVCDIGANKGSYLFWLSRWVKDGRVIAFEPQPDLASYLRTACRKLSLNNIIIEASGVFSTTETRTLYASAPNSPGASLNANIHQSGEGISVPVVSLDDYFKTNRLPDILKIDVEGAELNVFKGAERILSERGPLLVFECEQRHLSSGSVFDVFAYLEARGYAGQFVNGDRLSPLADFSLEKHQRQGPGRFWTDKNYRNNFVFSKR